MPLFINRWRTVATAGASTPSMAAMSPVRTWSEFRHRAKIFLLERGQTVKATAEEVGVQMGDDAGGGFLNMGELDRALGCRVPDVEAPRSVTRRISSTASSWKSTPSFFAGWTAPRGRR